MPVLPPRKPICSWPANPQSPSQSDLCNGGFRAATVQWHFKKEDAESALCFVNKLKIHKQLADMGAPVQQLLRYSHFDEESGHVVQAEFKGISGQILPKWRHVNECMDAMISCFSVLTEIHARNVYHGNPSIENFIFQRVDNAEAETEPIKSYLTNFHDCGHINEDQARCAKDVQIALSDFGGQLLLVAENSGFTQTRFLKMHLEAQVNFADQEELDSLESAPTLLNHLCSLRTILKLRQRDYPRHYQPKWGPLDQERVLKKHQEIQQRKKADLGAEMEMRAPLEPLKNAEGNKSFFVTKAGKLAILTAGAAITFWNMRGKDLEKE